MSTQTTSIGEIPSAHAATTRGRGDEAGTNAPNYLRRRALAVGIAGVVAVGGWLGTEAISNIIKFNKATSALKKAGTEADDQYLAGKHKFGGQEVVGIRVPETEFAASVAASVSSEGHTLDNQGIIIAETQGEDASDRIAPVVGGGQLVVLPKRFVNPDAIGQISNPNDISHMPK